MQMYFVGEERAFARLRRGSLRPLRRNLETGLPRRSHRNGRRLVGEVGLEPTKA